MSENLISIAIPKGRLQKKTEALFHASKMPFEFTSRELTAENPEAGIRAILVKNSDLVTYVSHGIAGIGIGGDDLLQESDARFFKLLPLPFGSTKMCLAAKAEGNAERQFHHDGGHITVATKFTEFTRNHFHGRGIPVQIIKLNGSVELAPLLGLAPYIVDLVETGDTLRENNLVVLEELATTRVHLVANRAYYKIHYRAINRMVENLKRGIQTWQSK
jgi:ATP phosphoribosyltransferase